MASLFWRKGKRWKPRMFYIGLGLLLIFTNEVIVNELLGRWEPPPVPINSITTPYDAAIVLGGVTTQDMALNDRVYLNKGADRILHAMQLYKEGKVKYILVSGASGSMVEVPTTEAENMRRLLLTCGVPDSVIIIESKSHNTRENAAFSAKILNSKFNQGKFLLVTSAFHMRRAKACFDKTGLVVDTFPTDFYVTSRNYPFTKYIIPDHHALTKWSILMKEVAGMAVYKVAGYI